MKVKLSYSNSTSDQTKPEIIISGSKSESNRLLILQKLFPGIQLENLSNSDDTLLLIKALDTDKNNIDVRHAGTAMRFLTAYYSLMTKSTVEITGSERMQERPIGILVDALRDLGADIQYLNEEGYPPLRIKGTKSEGGSLSIDAGISSQFISALMLIAPALPKGLTIDLKGEIVSSSYIKLTIGILNSIGIDCRLEENMISIKPFKFDKNITLQVESDWSSASYWYGVVALSYRNSITLKNFNKSSCQGDSVVASIFERLGVSTNFNSSDSSITISKVSDDLPDIIQLDLLETPDLAQTIAVTCFGLGVECVILGLSTLQIKETDRLTALKNELEKLGAAVTIRSNTIRVRPTGTFKKNVEINTYDDHRMALSFALLAMRNPIVIDRAEVVSKSYPSFWEDLQKGGFSLNFE